MIKVKRAEFYKDRSTQILLNKFLSGELEKLEPVYDPKLGYRYPIVEEIVGDALSVESLLNKLHEAEILDRTLYDKIIYCPECGSPNISVRYCCPHCRSFNIEKSSLIEHIRCGYIDVEENFRSESKFQCPKCSENLRKPDVDYRRAGIWCLCKECSKSFDIPETAHFCRNCDRGSTFENAVIKDVFAYSLREDIEEEVAVSWIIITPIRRFLQENGFEVESPAYLKGRSGAKHMFDVAAYKGEMTNRATVMDLAISTEDVVPEQPVIALFAKIFDVSPDSAYLIAIPKMSENGKKMAELYNITLVEAKNPREAVEALKEKLLNKE